MSITIPNDSRIRRQISDWRHQSSYLRSCKSNCNGKFINKFYDLWKNGYGKVQLLACYMLALGAKDHRLNGKLMVCSKAKCDLCLPP